jgi:hypothetical protein
LFIQQPPSTESFFFFWATSTNRMRITKAKWEIRKLIHKTSSHLFKIGLWKVQCWGEPHMYYVIFRFQMNHDVTWYFIWWIMWTQCLDKQSNVVHSKLITTRALFLKMESTTDDYNAKVKCATWSHTREWIRRWCKKWEQWNLPKRSMASKSLGKLCGWTNMPVTFTNLFTFFFLQWVFNITDTVLLVFKHHIMFNVPCFTSNIKFKKKVRNKNLKT